MRRPHSVTVIGALFIAAGIVGLAYHATELKLERSFQYDVIWVCSVRFLAIVCGLFLLRGSNWARWGLLVWLAYHIILSTVHSLSALLVHSLLFAVFAYLLWRPPASAYFRRARAEAIPAARTAAVARYQKAAGAALLVALLLMGAGLCVLFLLERGTPGVALLGPRFRCDHPGGILRSAS